MTILHLANDYSWTKVHSKLYNEIDLLGCVQKVFTPLRYLGQEKKNIFDFKTHGSQLIFSDIISNYHRIFFRLKIRKLFLNIENKIDLKEIDISHATTLFSDGALAYKIFKKYNIPYIVTIRDTDINIFLKYRPDLFLLGHNILKNAKKIIFISDANKAALFNQNLIKFRRKDYLSKTLVVYNGIDDFWINNRKNKKNNIENKVLYIGSFIKRKNVSRLIDSLAKLKSTVPDLELGIIGGGGGKEKEVLNLIYKKNWIHFYEEVYDKKKLLEIFDNHKIFAMVSFHETFGLVYIEALSQGLPILFTKGQGVDGVFNIKVGEAVNPYSKEDIQNGIQDIIENYQTYDLDKIDFSVFNWSNIAIKYHEIYKSLIQLDNPRNQEKTGGLKDKTG